MLTRIVTAVLAGSITLAAILWREPWGVVALLLAVSILGVVELVGMESKSWPHRGVADLIPFVFMVWMAQNWRDITETLVVLGIAFVIGFLGLILRLPNDSRRTLLLTLWIACGAFSALWLQFQGFGSSTMSPNLLLIAILPLWIGDSLAYFVGKSLGKHKLAPSISPNKTWEGAIANLTGCLAAAVAIGVWLNLPVAASIAVGLTTGIIGQIGDLLQSRIKRLSNVKDSGSILPGHGGVLDRLDSFLFSAYPSLLALWLLAPEAFHVKQWPW